MNSFFGEPHYLFIQWDYLALF